MPTLLSEISRIISLLETIATSGTCFQRCNQAISLHAIYKIISWVQRVSFLNIRIKQNICIYMINSTTNMSVLRSKYATRALTILSTHSSATYILIIKRG